MASIIFALHKVARSRCWLLLGGSVKREPQGSEYGWDVLQDHYTLSPASVSPWMPR